ncbi:Glycosyl hydrolases family 28 [Musa troglodytarum]|uniref:Glycosyl hydrolases family 28 n=1 Tax=Musa troglodytarum TaxID=320322 RepID=A0A9E7IBZ4_9LILI|nr:Glycosyl hydrolases family 28 [Musa troglodytarum]
MDSPRMHISLEKCTGVDASHLTITAPTESPNTDGIHITHSKNVKIANSFIGTGDDCISIVSGSKNVMATNIVCGPGHGISLCFGVLKIFFFKKKNSIGSLGAHNSEAQVSNVTVDRARFIGTTNGVRIKTWQV